MNAKNKNERAELVVAAETLAIALTRYAAMITETERMPLETQKGIDRAARAIQEAAVLSDEMGGLVTTLAKTIASMSEDQNALSQQLIARSREVKRRHQEMLEYSARLEALAAESKRINEDVQGFDGSALPTVEAKVQFVSQLAERMAPLIEDSRTLATDADRARFPDIERSAKGLSQTLASAKNKLELTAKRMVS